MARKPPVRSLGEKERRGSDEEEDFDIFDFDFPDPPDQRWKDSEDDRESSWEPPEPPPEVRAPRERDAEFDVHPDLLPELAPPASADLESQLDSYTVKALKERADELGVDLTGKRLKAEIIDAIVMSLRVRGEEPEPLPVPDDFLETETLPPPPPDFSPEPVDDDLHFGKLEDLWIEATNALAQEDYKSALALSRDSLLLVDQWATRYRRGMCTRALQAVHLFLRRFRGARSANGLRGKVHQAEEAFQQGDLDRCVRLIDDIQDDIADVYVEEMGRVRDILVEKENILEELGVINADLVRAREMLIRAEEALRLGDHARTLELIHGFEDVVEEARQKRRGELEEYLDAVESMITETEGLGSPLDEARKLSHQARTAFERGDLVLASELAQRAERSAMEAQKRQIEVAMQLRRKHYREVRDLVAYLKPLLAEAQDYGIDTGEVKTLVREAVELLRREDYFLAMERGQEARRLLGTLHSQMVAEREQRGITQPTKGLCERCASGDVEFRADGWAACNACGHRFLWSRRDPPRESSFFRRRTLAP